MLVKTGKGCEGSMASGVSAGRISRSKRGDSSVRELSLSCSRARTSMPWAASAGSSFCFQQSCWAWTKSRVRCRTEARNSLVAGWLADSSCCIMPATRISKNSSRFELTIERKRTRSRRGTESSSASSRTRRSKLSQLSSRLNMEIRREGCLVRKNARSKSWSE